MLYRVKVQPSGCINGYPWPEVGETIDLPKAAGDGMVKAGWLERAGRKESRPGKPAGKVETR